MKYRVEALMSVKGLDDGWRNITGLAFSNNHKWRNTNGLTFATRDDAVYMASTIQRNDVTKKIRIRRAA